MLCPSKRAKLLKHCSLANQSTIGAASSSISYLRSTHSTAKFAGMPLFLNVVDCYFFKSLCGINSILLLCKQGTATSKSINICNLMQLEQHLLLEELAPIPRQSWWVYCLFHTQLIVISLIIVTWFELIPYHYCANMMYHRVHRINLIVLIKFYAGTCIPLCIYWYFVCFVPSWLLFYLLYYVHGVNSIILLWKQTLHFHNFLYYQHYNKIMK